MKLTIIRGVSGSGKTTYAKKMDCLHIEADMFFIENSEYVFNAASLSENHKLCLQLASKCLKNGSDCVVSNTFTQKWEMKPYIDLAKRVGATVDIVRMEKKYKSIHNVPAHVIEQQRQRFEDFEGEKIKK